MHLRLPEHPTANKPQPQEQTGYRATEPPQRNTNCKRQTDAHECQAQRQARTRSHAQAQKRAMQRAPGDVKVANYSWD
jgi:hypothetical protein